MRETSARRLSFGISIFLALFLSFAAILKADVLRSQHDRQWQWFAVIVELAVAFWLFSGIRGTLARRAALVLFALFALVSFYLAISGARSCGCFGKIQVNPWVTFCIDLAACALLIMSELAESNQLRGSFALPAAAVSTVLLLAFAGFIHLLWRPVSLEAADASASLIILDPQKWIGRSWPLREFVDCDLSSGAWTAVLYHHDCDECLKELPEFEWRARGGERVALIEMPPYAPAGRDPVSKNTSCKRARLSKDKEWFAQTPSVVYLLDGIVVQK